MNKLTNLDYLYEVAAGDEAFIQDIIQTFIRQIPEYCEHMNEYLRQGEYIQLAAEAHKAKSSVIVFGLKGLATRLKELQLLAMEGKNPETYAGYISEFREICLQAAEEIKLT